MVEFPSAVDSYFILNRGPQVGNITSAVDMVLGRDGVGQLADSITESGLAFYNVQMVPLVEPGDTDGDAIDDGYELQHSNVLNPLDPTDASLDSDDDGVSNLREYERGTEPGNPASVNITLYVDSLLGLDSLNGLTPTPGASPVGPKQTIQGGIQEAFDGDVLEVAEGSYSDTLLSPGSKSIILRPKGAVTFR